jgi:cob(I)alamin adenosyltransferase
LNSEFDESNTFLAFARSICQNMEIAEWTETIKRTIFRLGNPRNSNSSSGP